MEISILTPCYKPDPCLLGCLESVRAQVTSLHPLRVSVHHHVQDGGSGQETVQLLEQFQKQTEEQALPGYRFTFKSEPDEGMYDAMNRAFAATSGEIIGHLNSDEQ